MYIYIYTYIYIYIHVYICMCMGKREQSLAARPYESFKNIQGLAPPRCPFGTGTAVVQNISN